MGYAHADKSSRGVDREMIKEDYEASTLLALAIGTAIGVVIGAAFYAAAYPIFQSENWAVWVQAIGVLTGVGVAVGTPIWQQNKKRAEVAEQDKRLKLSVVSAMLESMDSMAALIDGYASSEANRGRVNEDPLTGFSRLFAAWHDGLGLLNPLKVGLPSLLVPFLDLRYLALQLSQIHSHFNVAGSHQLTLAEKLDIARGVLADNRAHVSEAVLEHDLPLAVEPWVLPESVTVTRARSHSMNSVSSIL